MPRKQSIWIAWNEEIFYTIPSLDNVNLQAMSVSVFQTLVHVKWLLGISPETLLAGYISVPENTLYSLDSYYKKLQRYLPQLEHECKRRGIKWEE